ncbi:hypothetical protein KM031_01190 [Gemmobacter fulvus]|uniref:Uncharacterized protein n=1 Tax=Gemmobacter fulvus TaxID=2840474 RepID=A0A975P8V5_9RHOB|nr:hypothetical protein [Gemmobacter fulvus]MBT9245091.1 hypothetical protein [Gemmobacter fulvus]MDQ1847958.1 hypothetical protein [Gemmobacter fulvus]QWK90566.1 hypothetical protein KM031_01190 [Gemmobacter fulvus]
MGVTEDLSDALARDVIAAMDEMGNDRFYMEVAKMLGSMSPSMEEGFMTAIRVRLAEQRGRDFLAKKLAAHRKGDAGV